MFICFIFAFMSKQFKKELLKDFKRKNKLDIKQTYILPIDDVVYYIKYVSKKWIVSLRS